MPDVIRTASRIGRSLSGPAITFSIAEEIKILRQEPEWLSGTIQVGVSGELKTLEAGDAIALEKGVPHDILALDDSDLLLTIVKEVK